MRYTFSVVSRPCSRCDILCLHCNKDTLLSLPFEYNIRTSSEGFDIWSPTYSIHCELIVNEKQVTFSFEGLRLCLSIGDWDIASLMTCLKQMETNYLTRKEQWRLQHYDHNSGPCMPSSQP